MSKSIEELVSFAHEIADGSRAFKKPEIQDFMRDLLGTLSEPQPTSAVAAPTSAAEAPPTKLTYGQSPVPVEIMGNGNLIIRNGAITQYNRREALALGHAIVALAETMLS